MGQQSDTDVSIDDSFSAGASVTIDEDKRLDFAKKILAVMGWFVPRHLLLTPFFLTTRL